jgi:hypothetical protein
MDFEDGVTLHLSGEELAIYQVGLSALASLALTSLDQPDDLENYAAVIEGWEQGWDETQNKLVKQYRDDPKAFWEKIIGAKANLLKNIWG